MTEEALVKRLKRQKPEALEAMIGQYNNYVCTIIINIIGSGYNIEDVKEIASDVFMAVWRHASSIQTGKVKAYIGSTARNKTRDFLRKRKSLEMDIDEIPIFTDGQTPESQLLKQEQIKAVRAAVLNMSQPDREIFLRYYYYLQTTVQIASEMGMEANTVRGRLMRGRIRLKEALTKEGFL